MFTKHNKFAGSADWNAASEKGRGERAHDRGFGEQFFGGFGGRHFGGGHSDGPFGGHHFGGHHFGGHHFGGRGEHPFHGLRGRMQEFFQDFSMDRFRAPVNVYRTENTYEVLVFAPGRKKEQFRVKIQGGQLIVSYEPPANATRPDWVRKEYSRGGFERSFPLDDTIETEEVQAKYEDGVLQLSLKIKPGSVTPAQEVPVN